MQIRDILKEYDIGKVINVLRPQYGSNDSYIITADKGKFVLKDNQRADFIEAQYFVNKSFEKNDSIVNKIIPTRNQKLVTCNHALFEYIEGQVYDRLSKEQILNSLKFMAFFNEKLKIVKLEEIRILELNIWDKSRSVQYIKNNFADDIKLFDMPMNYKQKISQAIDFVKTHSKDILTNNNQLIHSDLGGDNFVFDDKNQVIGVIDFTPEVGNEYYSVAHFVYWNYLWHTNEISYQDLLALFNYYSKYSTQKIEERHFIIFLIKASITRLAGLVLSQIEKNVVDLEQIDKRVEIVITLINYFYSEFQIK